MTYQDYFFCFFYIISTHTPLAGRDVTVREKRLASQSFLLTRPLRDVTLSLHHLKHPEPFLLTRPLRDVTVLRRTGNKRHQEFLLTRPLRDVTRLNFEGTGVSKNFYSHAPCGT